MKFDLRELSLGLLPPDGPVAAVNRRPPSWPPPRDWPVSIDEKGRVVSRWGDPTWDLTPLAGRVHTISFGDGEERTSAVARRNADVLRLAATWFLWGHRAARVISTFSDRFVGIRSVIDYCTSKGIAADLLMRHPRMMDELPSVISRSKYSSVISYFHRLYDARDILGFSILDSAGLQELVERAPDYEKQQTPYIPPRIWLYQIERLRACVDDFLAHADQISECFQHCVDAYVENYGSIEAALESHRHDRFAPFCAGTTRKPVYLGPFADFAAAMGIDALLCKWLPTKDLRISSLSSYMTLVSWVSVAYIANFTLQRKEEAASLRWDCMKWEEDEKLGRVLTVCGETTKTQWDSDARWVASPSIEPAVRALQVITKLRMSVDKVNKHIAPSKEDQANPYLFSAGGEPWVSGGTPRPYRIRTELRSFKEMMGKYPALFDKKVLSISREDLRIARQLTPNLSTEEFAAGKVWPLMWHQLRRTSAVNMFASGLISDSSIQLQMKHCSRLMPLYYGRNYTRLLLNSEVEYVVINAMYEAMTERIKAVVGLSATTGDKVRFAAAPQIVSVADMKQLLSWAKQGSISFREHRLGGCMSPGPCEYGGIESVARCGGGDVKGRCADVVYDRAREPDVRAELADINRQISRLRAGSARRRALCAERRALRNYLDDIQAI